MAAFLIKVRNWLCKNFHSCICLLNRLFMNAFSIHIPEPCHEDWQQMAPVDKGRFCQSCAKQVVDFSMMTDQEILNYISKASGSVCGRFVGGQIQRPLQPVKQEKKKVWWVAAAMPLLMLFEKGNAQKKGKAENGAKNNIIKLERTTSLMGDVVITRNSNNAEEDSFTDKKPYFNSKITVQRLKDSSDFAIAGEIEDASDNSPLPFATIRIKDSKVAVLANEAGKFILHGNTTANNVVLTISAVSFENAEIFVRLKDTINTTKETHIIAGVVLSAKTEMPISFAYITLKNGKENVATDAYGKFTLPVTGSDSKVELVVSSVGYRDTGLTVSLKDTSLQTIRCKEKELDPNMVIVVGGAFACHRPLKKDTIPALIRKVFHAEKFKVSPNPAPRGGSINIDVKNAGIYSIQLFDNSGKLVQVKQFDVMEGVTQTTMDIPSSLAAGMYYIRLVDNKKKKEYTDKIVVE